MHIVASTLTLDRHGHPFNPVWSGLLENVPDGRGRLSVEVQDEKGRVIPGYAAADCLTEVEGPDALRIAWTSGKDLTALRGRLVRFRFVLSNARLYSFLVD